MVIIIIVIVIIINQFRVIISVLIIARQNVLHIYR